MKIQNCSHVSIQTVNINIFSTKRYTLNEVFSNTWNHNNNAYDSQRIHTVKHGRYKCMNVLSTYMNVISIQLQSWWYFAKVNIRHCIFWYLIIQTKSIKSVISAYSIRAVTSDEDVFFIRWTKLVMEINRLREFGNLGTKASIIYRVTEYKLNGQKGPWPNLH